MPYFGVRVKHKLYEITVKIHGPLITFEIVPTNLKETITEYLADKDGKFNIIEVAHDLAENIAEKHLNGDTRLWVEVEVNAGDNLIFGSSAMRLDGES